MVDYTRDLSDFIDDVADCEYDNPIVAQLPILEEKITTLLHKLRAQIDRIKTDQHNALLKRSVRSSAPVAHKDSWAVTRQRALMRPQRAPSMIAVTEIKEREVSVPITNSVSISATEIYDICEAQKSGVLYYIPTMRRFVLRIANMTLYGNIGLVYGSESTPSRVHDCAMYPRCRSDCDFYHNPLKCKNSTDIRNFYAISWLYPPDARRKTDKKRMRKIASLDCIDRDLASITADDVSYYSEQLMHDILCFAIMNYYVKVDT